MTGQTFASRCDLAGASDGFFGVRGGEAELAGVPVAATGF